MGLVEPADRTSEGFLVEKRLDAPLLLSHKRGNSFHWCVGLASDSLLFASFDANGPDKTQQLSATAVRSAFVFATGRNFR